MSLPFNHVPYRIIPLARVIAYKLYVQHVNDSPIELHTIDEIRDLFKNPISKNLMKSSLDVLHAERFIIRVGSKSSTPTYKIISAGIQMVEQALRNKESDLSYLMEHGDGVLSEIAGIDAIWMTNEDRIDADAWAPLKIDRDDPQYQEALRAVDEAIEKIRTDNGYATTHSDERRGILGTLSAGREWLAERYPNYRQVVDQLVSPLRSIATRFRESIIGNAASRAAQALLDWLARFL